MRGGWGCDGLDEEAVVVVVVGLMSFEKVRGLELEGASAASDSDSFVDFEKSPIFLVWLMAYAGWDGRRVVVLA